MQANNCENEGAERNGGSGKSNDCDCRKDNTRDRIEPPSMGKIKMNTMCR